MITSYNSLLLDNAVTALSKLPGIGPKTALRLALYLLRQDENIALNIGESLIKLRKEITYCEKCHNISESSTCQICSDPRRDNSIICVVENVKDVLTIESTNQFKGVYHVLGGLISPIDGIGPADLEIESLVKRVKNPNDEIKEIILALSPTIEGDTTNFYIFRKLEDSPVKITILARGLSVGGELDYTDELTLGRSIINRIPFETK